MSTKDYIENYLNSHFAQKQLRSLGLSSFKCLTKSADSGDYHSQLAFDLGLVSLSQLELYYSVRNYVLMVTSIDVEATPLINLKVELHPVVKDFNQLIQEIPMLSSAYKNVGEFLGVDGFTNTRETLLEKCGWTDVNFPESPRVFDIMSNQANFESRVLR